jgi:hypothetical protein
MLTHTHCLTQKARGVLALADSEYPTMSARAFASLETLRQYGRFTAWPRFARPCPVTPQHGFVESRIVQSVDEALDVFREARAADPQAELLLMPPIPAVCSAILTPGALVLGPSHDGATSGRNAITLPIRSDLRTSPQLLRIAGVTDHPYFEVVVQEASFGGELPFVVQLRNGPALPTGVDYVPRRITVQSVVVADGDLIEWGERCKQFTPGTVVDHYGGSLASHYGVHCILHGIPILTSRHPQVGDCLQPSTRSALDLDLLLQGFHTAMADPEWHWTQDLSLVLFGLHNMAWLDASGPGATLLGMSLAYALRLSTLAVAGEARHYRRVRKGKDSRNRVYVRVWGRPYTYIRRLPLYHQQFTDYGRWGSSYGGFAWAKCTEATMDLWNAIYYLVATPSTSTYSAAMAALNVTVNMAHNNGFFLNKFGGGFKEAAQGATPFFVQAIPALWRALHLQKAAKPRWKHAPVTCVVTPPA